MSLTPVRAKLARAGEHEAEFQRCLDEYVAGDNFELRHDFDPNTGWNEIRFIATSDPPAERLTLILGDIMTNARGALDYLAWELVLAAGSRPGRHTMFPIVSDKARWPRAVSTAVKGVDPRWVAVIESLQPFHEANPALHFLSALDDMNNYNKHRTLPGALQMAAPLSFPMQTVPGLEYEFDPVEPRLEDGAVLFRIRPHDKRRVELSQVDLRVRFAFDIGTGVEWDTADMLTELETTITKFEPAFPS